MVSLEIPMEKLSLLSPKNWTHVAPHEAKLWAIDHGISLARGRGCRKIVESDSFNAIKLVPELTLIPYHAFLVAFQTFLAETTRSFGPISLVKQIVVLMF